MKIDKFFEDRISDLIAAVILIAPIILCESLEAGIVVKIVVEAVWINVLISYFRRIK